MRTKKEWRLAAMMALVFAVQGAYWPLLAVHLADLSISSRARGWIFATLALGSSLVPFAAGQLVDRLMATERYLALVFALGTGLLVLLASGIVNHAIGIFALFLAYWALIGPSYGLCNSLAMRNLDEPGRQFGWVRLWGTAGWMGSGWLVSIVMASTGTARAGHGAFEALWIGALLSSVVSIYCLTLPHTPPLAVGSEGKRAISRSFDLVRRSDIAVLLLTSFGLYLTVPMGFQVLPGYLEARGLPRAWTSTALTLGQMSEIGMLAILPWLLRRFRAKGTLALGITAWFLRYLHLSLQPPLWLAVAGTLLQGVGFACFTIGASVYIDSRCSAHLRASAQALLVVSTSGFGALLGNLMAGEITGHTSPDDVLVFLIPCVIDGALLLYFLRGFRAPVSSVAWAGAANAGLASPPHSLCEPVARAGLLVTEPADG
jgi:MFS family permease